MLAIVDDVAIYLDTAGVAAAVIGDAAVEDRWDKASALRGMSVAGLAGHLARSILLTEPFLDEEPADGAPLSVVDYYLAGDEPTDFDSRASRRVRETGEATAAGGPAALRSAVNDSLQGLRRRLPNEDLDVARMWFGRVTTTRTVLQARTLEMLVHVDDLAISVGVPTPHPPPSALDVTIQMLIDMARCRHGDLAVLRALTRRERDPNRALRVL